MARAYSILVEHLGPLGGIALWLGSSYTGCPQRATHTWGNMGADFIIQRMMRAPSHTVPRFLSSP